MCQNNVYKNDNDDNNVPKKINNNFQNLMNNLQIKYFLTIQYIPSNIFHHVYKVIHFQCWFMTQLTFMHMNQKLLSNVNQSENMDVLRM